MKSPKAIGNRDRRSLVQAIVAAATYTTFKEKYKRAGRGSNDNTFIKKDHLSKLIQWLSADIILLK